MKKKAVVLLSGGLDSSTILAVAKAKGFDVYALSFDYGQRNKIELKSAQQIAKSAKAAEHRVCKIDLGLFGGSCLTDSTIQTPKNNAVFEDSKNKENIIPVSYVPARNTVFLSYALAYAEVVDAFDIFYGANAVDYSGYPDCRPAYKEAFEKMANLALKSTAEGHSRMRIHAPLIEMTKAQIIQEGQKLGVDYSSTLSCYDPKDDLACGCCDACHFRKKGFEEAKIPDPTRYFG